MNIANQIWNLKLKIDDIRMYIASELCTRPMDEYKKIAKYELEILELRKQIEEQNERPRSSEK